MSPRTVKSLLRCGAPVAWLRFDTESMPVFDAQTRPEALAVLAASTKSRVAAVTGLTCPIFQALATSHVVALFGAIPSRAELRTAQHCVGLGQVYASPALASALLHVAREVAQTPNPTARLTDRERDVAVLLCSRMSNRAMAARLFVSEYTVRNHLQHIYRKLGVTGRDAAIEILLEYLAPLLVPPGAQSD